MNATNKPTSSVQRRGAGDGRGSQLPVSVVARGHLVLIVLFTPVVAALAWSSADRLPMIPPDSTGPYAHLVQSRLDINQAPWWEMTALPRIGRITAGRITDYREEKRRQHPDRPPFRNGTELQEVHGIGPKTAALLDPYIRWP